MFALRWNAGVHNYMAYVTGDIPVGAYNPTRLANIGIGHGAIDAGGGYTYFNPQTGHEFSAVLGMTYNFKNPDTQYQSGVDLHLDWAASQFLSKQTFVGVVGYVYKQVGCDSGSGDRVGCFQSQVAAAGPQVVALRRLMSSATIRMSPLGSGGGAGLAFFRPGRLPEAFATSSIQPIVQAPDHDYIRRSLS